MLAGEYAVLHGSPALVMAVDRHAVAGTAQGSVAQTPEVTATLDLALREGLLGRAHPEITVDTSRLAGDGGRKLGLGSSAAGCVAALALALAREGRDVTDTLALGRMARRGHRAAQGGGSGVDVMASALGGVVGIALPDGLDGEPVVAKRDWPAELPWVVLWTGVPARTSELLGRVEALAQRDPAEAQRCWDGIAAATADLDAALSGADARAAVRAVTDHARWMDALGRAAGVGIVTEPLRRLAAVLEPLGAAVKPSGAGGGDVALAIAQDAFTLAAATAEAVRAGFTVVDLAPDAHGVRVTEGDLEHR